MGTKIVKAVAVGQPTVDVFPAPILAQRAPATTDTSYPAGQLWVDQSVSPVVIYFHNGAGVWDNGGNAMATTTAPGIVEIDTTVDAADDDTVVPTSKAVYDYGQTLVLAGANIASDVAQGIAYTATNAQCVAGTANTATEAYMVSPDNLATIFASPNGAIGVTAAVAGTFTDLTADGTGAVSLTGNAASTLTNTAGDLTIDAQAASLILDSGEAATADSVRIVASAGDGGIDVDAGSSGITIDSTGAVSIDAAAASNFSTSSGDLTLHAVGACNLTSAETNSDSINVTSGGGMSFVADGAAGKDIVATCTSGSIHLTAGEAVSDAVNVDSSGGFDLDAVGQVNIASSQNASDAVSINASAGGIEIIAVGAAAEDLVLQNTNGSVNVVAGEADPAAVSIQAAAGGLDADFALLCSIVSSQAAATAITLEASAANGGVTISAGTGGLLFGGQADCTTISLGDIAPTANRTVTIAGGTVITASTTDLVDIAPDGATTNADSIKHVTINNGGVTLGQILTDIAAGAITSGTHTVNIQSGNAAAGTVACNISTGSGTKDVNIGNADANTTMTLKGAFSLNSSINANVDINAGTSTGTIDIGNTLAGAVTLNSGSTIAIGDATAGAVSIDTGAGISIDAATASNLTCAAGDMTVEATAGSLNLTSGEAIADSVVVTAGGGIDILAPSGGAGLDIDITNTGGSVNVSATEAIASAIIVNASAGGLQLLAGGGAGLDTVITNTSGSMTFTAGESAADAMNLTASGAASGMNFSCGTSGFSFDSGLRFPVTAKTAAYNVAVDDFLLTGDTSGTPAFSFTLPAAPNTGTMYCFADVGGNAAAANITINGNGNNINSGGASAATAVINSDYGNMWMWYDGTIWAAIDVA